MALHTSGQISAGHARQEGNKTSWVSPNYPTIGRQYDITPNWIIEVDESNKLGYNPDGSFTWAKLFGWETWNRPIIDWVYVHQFKDNGGIRIVWRAYGGDIFRTGWAIYISTSGYPSPGSPSGYDYQYGSEHNPGASDSKQQYNNTVDGMTLDDGSQWHSVNAFGDYAVGAIVPNTNLLIDPTAGTFQPAAVFSYTYEGQLLTVDGATPHYVTVVAVDARANDTLGMPRNANVEAMNRSGSSWPSGNQKNSELGPGWSYFDADNGDGGLILFDGVGSPSWTNIHGSGFDIDITNAYTFYLGGVHLYHWVYITDDTTEVNHPFFPGDPDIPDGHPYDDPDAGWDEYDSFGLDKWVRFEGDPIVIQGLAQSTDYSVSVAKYRAADLDRYENYGVNNADISAPASDRDIVGNTKGSSSTQVTTTSSSSDTQQLADFTIDSKSGNNYGLSWSDPNNNSNYIIEAEYDNDGNWMSCGVSNKVNWGTSGDESADASPSELPDPSHTEIRFRIQVQGETDWLESGNVWQL